MKIAREQKTLNDGRQTALACLATGLAVMLSGACRSTSSPELIDSPSIAIEEALPPSTTLIASRHNDTPHDEDNAIPSSDADKQTDYLCRTPAVTCPINDWMTATLCTVHTYQGQMLEPKTMLQAWGRTPCLARLAIHTLACDNNPNPQLDPQFYQEVVCSPDPSNRECPIGMAACPSDQAATPTECRAVEYEGEALPADQQFSAKGSSLCEARSQLLLMACINLLRPSAISNMSCTPNASPSCNSADHACHDTASFPALPTF